MKRFLTLALTFAMCLDSCFLQWNNNVRESGFHRNGQCRWKRMTRYTN